MSSPASLDRPGRPVRPAPTVLTGRLVVLEPLTEEHLEPLRAAIGRPEVFAAGYGGGPSGLPDGAEAFRAGLLVISGLVALATLVAVLDAVRGRSSG